jgi:hypothetical protein
VTGVLAAVIAGVQDWLLEPADAQGPAEVALPAGPRPVVAVFGLAPRSGATVVARALAAELAGRDDAAAAAVTASVGGAAIPLASGAASELARALADIPRASTRATGRLCLVEGPEPAALAGAAREVAPLVLDAGDGPLGGVPAAVADTSVLVATPRVEPALVTVAAACLSRLGREPLVAVNRLRGEQWPGTPSVELPESRTGAQLALSGREARGELGRAVARLADLVCGELP